MSAASQARDRAAREKFIWISQEDDGVDPDDIAGQVVLWDMERLLAWYVQKRADIKKHLNARDYMLDDEDGLMVVPAITLRHDRK